MTTEDKQSSRQADILDSISIAAFDLDGRIFRTLWHSLVRTPEVALAAARGDFSRYLSPIRVFVAMFGFQVIVASLFGTPLTMTWETLVPPGQEDVAIAWLESGQTASGETPTPDEVGRKLEEWGALFLWPITVFSSLPYLILLKLYRLRTPFWGHLQLYLVPTNASFIALIAALPLLAVGWGWFMAGMLAGLVVYFFCMGRVIVRFYSHSALGAAVRLVGLLLVLPVNLTLSTLGMFLSAAWILESQFGLGMLDLYIAAARA